MGSNTSKTTGETVGAMQTKDPELSGNSDPRSPTPEIARTPLQGKSGEKQPITKNINLSKTFEKGSEESYNYNYPILSAVVKNHLQLFDPRSPTIEIDRTPIVLTNENRKTKAQLRQEAITDYGTPTLKETPVDDLDDSYLEEAQVASDIMPKNLCEEFFEMTFNESLKDPTEPLGSSTASQEAIESNISNGTEKPTTLLETNFDYVAESEGSVQEDSVDSKTFEILDNDPRSPSIGIERTPIVVTKNQADVEDLADDILIKALKNSNAELRNTLTRAHKNKEGLMIYEDESTVTNVTPRKSAPEGNGCRTPLSCMKNKGETTHVRSKSANTVLDPKSKIIPQTKRASHIPRLKALVKTTQNPKPNNLGSLKNLSKAVVGDCENTPPNSHRDIWDKDTSVVL